MRLSDDSGHSPYDSDPRTRSTRILSIRGAQGRSIMIAKPLFPYSFNRKFRNIMTGRLETLLDSLEAWGAEPRQVLEDAFLGDSEFYQSCLIKFAQDPGLQTLKDMLAQENIKASIHSAHTMKGIADYLGLFPVLDAAVTILVDLRTNDLSQARADLPELTTALAQFQTLLASFEEE